MRWIIFSTYIFLWVLFCSVLHSFCWYNLLCFIFLLWMYITLCLSDKGWPSFLFTVFLVLFSFVLKRSHVSYIRTGVQEPKSDQFLMYFPGMSKLSWSLCQDIYQDSKHSCCKIGLFNQWHVLILRSIATFHVSYHHTQQAFRKVFSRWLSMQHNTPEQWNGLMENKWKSLRLCHISKPSESCRSGKQMLNSGKPSCYPLLSESLWEKWTNTLHVFLNIAELLRINVLKTIPWKNSEYNRHIFVGTNSFTWGTIRFLMTSSLISTY